MRTNLEMQEWCGGGKRWAKQGTRVGEGGGGGMSEGEKAELGSSCWGFPPLMYPPPFFLTATVIWLKSVHVRNLHLKHHSHCRPPLHVIHPPDPPDGEEGEKGLAEASAEAI